jgi:hypothetical protein
MTEPLVQEDSAPHGIHLDAVPVDAEQVRALPGDHMQRLLPPPQTVLMNAYPAGDPSWLRIDSTYPEQMRQRLALLATRRTWVVDRMDSQAVLPAARQTYPWLEGQV